MAVLCGHLAVATLLLERGSPFVQSDMVSVVIELLLLLILERRGRAGCGEKGCGHSRGQFGLYVTERGSYSVIHGESADDDHVYQQVV